MADFTVRPTNAAFLADDISGVAGELERYEGEIRGIRSALGFRIAASGNLRYRLNNAAGRIESQSVNAEGMSAALRNILNRYENAEKTILGHEAVRAQATLAESGDGDTADSEDKDLRDVLQDILDVLAGFLGEFGFLGKILSLPLSVLQLFLCGGDGAKDFFGLLKDTGEGWNGIIDIAEWESEGREGGWSKFFGFDSKVDPEAGWWQNTKDSLKSSFGIEEANGKYRVKGTKKAGWLASFIKNGISNYDEYQSGLGTENEITKGRAVAETVSETVIDVLNKALIGAGITTACAALGFAAPAALVGGATVIVSGVADMVCEKLTGKSLTEWASDNLLDGLKTVGEKLTGAVSGVGRTMASWADKVFHPSSPQLAGA